MIRNFLGFFVLILLLNCCTNGGQRSNKEVQQPKASIVSEILRILVFPTFPFPWARACFYRRLSHAHAKC